MTTDSPGRGRQKPRPIFVLLVCTMLALPCSAGDNKHQSSKIEPSRSTTSSHNKATHSKAQLWSLTDAEWTRYETLLEGIRGSVSPATLSPIEVLGIHARDDQERNRFAERWALMMRDDAERILAFQHAYDAAQRLLFPNQPLIDRSLLPAPKEKSDQLQPTDRVLFFTEVGCAACDAVFDRLLAKRERIAGIDVYLVNGANNDQGVVREWAHARKIDPADVRSRTITLNLDAGILERMSDSPRQLPQLIRRRGDALLRLRSLTW